MSHTGEWDHFVYGAFGLVIKQAFAWTVYTVARIVASTEETLSKINEFGEDPPVPPSFSATSISERACPAVPETAATSGRPVGGTLGLPETREEAEALAYCNLSFMTRVTGVTHWSAGKFARGLDIH